MKKISLALGTITSIVAPIAAVVACGQTESTKKPPTHTFTPGSIVTPGHVTNPVVVPVGTVAPKNKALPTLVDTQGIAKTFLDLIIPPTSSITITTITTKIGLITNTYTLTTPAPAGADTVWTDSNDQKTFTGSTIKDEIKRIINEQYAAKTMVAGDYIDPHGELFGQLSLF